jgi:fumarate reductase flavoprotein subunit
MWWLRKSIPERRGDAGVDVLRLSAEMNHQELTIEGGKGMGRMGKVLLVLVFGMLFVCSPAATRGQTLNGDLIIVGGGGAGLTAAVTAAESGAKVMVFEKKPALGGTTQWSGGPMAVESRLQQRQYNTLTKDDAFRIIMDYNHWRGNPFLIRAFIDESAETIDWFERLGVVFGEPMANWVGSYFTQHVAVKPKARNAGIMQVLTEKVKEKGVEVFLETKVTGLIKEGDKVVGIVAQDKTGKTIEARAKAVFVATGGFANNKEWVKKYTGYDLGVNLFPVGPVAMLDLQGDGIQMAWNAGADSDTMIIQLQYNVMGAMPPGATLAPMARQPLLWVNSQGKRFIDEGKVINWPFGGNALTRQKDPWAWLIFDGNTKNWFETKGLLNGSAPLLPGDKAVDVDGQFAKANGLGNNNVMMAASLEELAKKTGLDFTALKATVDEYNKFCDQGHDAMFAKEFRYLQPVRTAKFYAIKIVPSYLGALGGVRVNEKMEVLDKANQKPIPGLYAGGNDVGGLYGDSYDFIMPGGTAGFTFNSGRIAAKNALKYIGK